MLEVVCGIRQHLFMPQPRAAFASPEFDPGTIVLDCPRVQSGTAKQRSKSSGAKCDFGVQHE